MMWSSNKTMRKPMFLHQRWTSCDHFLVFGERLISAGLWPQRSPVLNPLDFCLWGALKDKVYKTAPAILYELRGRIIEELEDITSDTCKKVFSNLIKQCHTGKEADGGQFQHVW